MLLGIALFHIPVQGQLISVYFACLVFILANLTLGLMISTLVANQLAAMQMSFYILLPSILFSGFMFPFVAMSKAAQYIAEILPLTHFLRVIRGVMLRGEPLVGLLEELSSLMIFSLIFLVISTLRFSKRLE